MSATRPAGEWDTYSRQIEAVDPSVLKVLKTKMGLRFNAGPEI
jgi:hypothetical protein